MREKKWRGKRKCPDRSRWYFHATRIFPVLVLLEKAPGRAVCDTEKREWYINTKKQSTEQKILCCCLHHKSSCHTTSLRGVSRLQCWLSLGALSKCLALELCIIFSISSFSRAATRWRRRRTNNTKHSDFREKERHIWKCVHIYDVASSEIGK